MFSWLWCGSQKEDIASVESFASFEVANSNIASATKYLNIKTAEFEVYKQQILKNSFVRT